MGSDIIDIDGQQWARTEGGIVILRLIEEWKAGLTEHGDVVLGFTSMAGNDPAIPAGEMHRSQFICTREDAREIAHMILRTLAFSGTLSAFSCDPVGAFDFAAFRDRIETPSLRVLADDWNKARGNRRVPSWNDINPEINAPYLSGMWGFDHVPASGEFIGRLAGSAVMLGYGRNFLGTPLQDLHPPHVYETVHAGLSRILSGPACCRTSGKLFRTGDKLVQGERLVLPMGDDPEHPNSVLGASWYDNYPLTRTPDRMELICDREDWCQL